MENEDVDDGEPARKKIALDLNSSFVPFNKEPIANSAIPKIDGKFSFEFKFLFYLASNIFSKLMHKSKKWKKNRR